MILRRATFHYVSAQNYYERRYRCDSLTCANLWTQWQPALRMTFRSKFKGTYWARSRSSPWRTSRRSSGLGTPAAYCSTLRAGWNIASQKSVIVSQLLGGLGNQLFSIAWGVLAERTGVELYFDIRALAALHRGAMRLANSGSAAER